MYMFWFFHMYMVEKVMIHSGHELKISDVSVSPEGTILVGKAVIPTAGFPWQATGVVTSQGFWISVLAVPLPVISTTDFSSLLHQVVNTAPSKGFTIRLAHLLLLNAQGSNAMKMPIIVSSCK